MAARRCKADPRQLLSIAYHIMRGMPLDQCISSHRATKATCCALVRLSVPQEPSVSNSGLPAMPKLTICERKLAAKGLIASAQGTFSPPQLDVFVPR